MFKLKYIISTLIIVIVGIIITLVLSSTVSDGKLVPYTSGVLTADQKNFNYALSLYESGKYEQSLTTLEDIINKDTPVTAKAMHLKVVVALEKGRINEAEMAFMKLKSFYPNSALVKPAETLIKTKLAEIKEAKRKSYERNLNLAKNYRNSKMYYNALESLEAARTTAEDTTEIDRLESEIREKHNPAPEGFTAKGKNTQGYEEYRHEQTGMIFVKIPAGEFMMGSNDGDSDEKPVHNVRLDSFLISKYEVTQSQWKKIMGSNPSLFKGDNHPVEKVSWNDCQEFCKKTGLKLPTEAQWEYVAKAGTTTKYYWGNKVDGDYAWHVDNGGMTTHSVGEKRPNGYGLYDMAGNVWEWCNDWYGEEYYKQSPIENPEGPAIGQYRVFRGGSWYSYAVVIRCANRYGLNPTSSNCGVGFRCVR